MQLVCGNYRFGVNEANISIQRQGQWSPVATELLIRETWRVRGYLQATISADTPGAGEASLSTQIIALENGFQLSGIDVLFYDSQGNLTPHGVLSSNTVGGTRITAKPSYPQGEGAQYATVRWYEITIEWDLPGQAFASGITCTEWNETVTFTGNCFPRFVYRPTLYGSPVRQTVQQATVCRATQSGNAVFLTLPGGPSSAQILQTLIPGPLWPGYLHYDQNNYSQTSPTVLGPTNLAGVYSYLYYPVQWNYQFEASVPLAGVPRARPY